MKAYGEVGGHEYIHLLLASALVADQWSASRSCRFTPLKEPICIGYQAGWVPELYRLRCHFSPPPSSLLCNAIGCAISEMAHLFSDNTLVGKKRRLDRYCFSVRRRVVSGQLHALYGWAGCHGNWAACVHWCTGTLVVPHLAGNIPISMTQRFITVFTRSRNWTLTPWPLLRKRTIPTDRPPLVDEI
jgi:hypothetical protein